MPEEITTFCVLLMSEFFFSIAIQLKIDYQNSNILKHTNTTTGIIPKGTKGASAAFFFNRSACVIS